MIFYSVTLCVFNVVATTTTHYKNQCDGIRRIS